MREQGVEASATLVRLTVGVTAHRDLLAEQLPDIRRHLDALFEELSRRFPATPLQALCPLAEGGDRLFARLALDRGIPLVIPVPYPREPFLEEFSDAESTADYLELSRHGSVIALPFEPHHLPSDPVQRRRFLDRQYARLGVFVASHCQVLVALWDGERSGLLGGTDQIVRYRLHNVYPFHEEHQPVRADILDEEQNDLVFHVRCLRSRAAGGEAGGPVTAEWLTGDSTNSPSSGLPERYARNFAAIGDFNHKISHPLQAAHGTSVIPRSGADGTGLEDDSLDRTFAVADSLASYFHRRLNLALRGTYVLAGLMGGTFVGYSTFWKQPALLYCFLGIFALGLLLYERARRKEWQRRYLEYRVLAEGLRVQWFWAVAGVGKRGDGRFILESFLRERDLELGWIRHVMRDVELRASAPRALGEEGIKLALRHWIGDPSEPQSSGQINYYRSEADRHQRWLRFTERIGMFCLWSGIAIAVVLAAAGTLLDTPSHEALLILIGLLPLLAAVRSAYSHQRADKELINQYRFMARTFATARERFDEARTAEQRREILRLLGNAALDEHAEWLLRYRERPLERSKL